MKYLPEENRYLALNVQNMEPFLKTDFDSHERHVDHATIL